MWGRRRWISQCPSLRTLASPWAPPPHTPPTRRCSPGAVLVDAILAHGTVGAGFAAPARLAVVGRRGSASPSLMRCVGSARVAGPRVAMRRGTLAAVWGPGARSPRPRRAASWGGHHSHGHGVSNTFDFGGRRDSGVSAGCHSWARGGHSSEVDHVGIICIMFVCLDLALVWKHAEVSRLLRLLSFFTSQPCV